MLFCCKLSAASASLAVKEFCKSVNVGQKYRQTHCIQFIGLHFRNIRSRSRFDNNNVLNCAITLIHTH